VKAVDVARRRMIALGLSSPLGSPADVVDHLGAVQAQDHAPALWSVAQRTRGGAVDPVAAAFARGDLLRTHVLRPTWHFVRPSDIRWMLALTAPRIRATMAYYARQRSIDDRLQARVDRVLAASLEVRSLTRAEIEAALARARIVASGERLGHLLIAAELGGLIASGGLRGKQQTWALLDARAPATPAPDRDEMLAMLATRYFTSHGPATAKDLAWWASLTLADVRRAIALAGRSLVAHDLDGVPAWSGPLDALPRAANQPAVHLLHSYDEYVVGYAGVARGRLVPQVVIDTQIAATWRRTIARGRVSIEIVPVRTLTRAESRAVAAAARAHADALGLPLTAA
jgi:hypothetical protein